MPCRLVDNDQDHQLRGVGRKEAREAGYIANFVFFFPVATGWMGLPCGASLSSHPVSRNLRPDAGTRTDGFLHHDN